MRENPWLQWMAVSGMTVALAIVGVYFTLMFNLQQAVERFFTGAKVVLVLTAEATPQRGAAIAAQVTGLSQVAEAAFVHKDQAMVRFAEQLGPKKGVLAGLPANPLPHTVEVLLNPGRDPGDGLIEELSVIADVEEVITSRPWLQALEEGRRAAAGLAAVLGLLLFMAVTMLSGNTVRLAYYARRSELEILDLMGSSPGYIRRPFIIEALLQGLLASALAHGLVAWLMWVLAAPATLPLGLDMSALFVLPPALPWVLAGVATGSALLGAWLGVGRSLRLARP